MKNFIYIFLTLISLSATSQDIAITGTVKDITTLMPIQGVSISIQNKNIGTITNDEGQFRILVNAADKALNFSHINFNTLSYDTEKKQVEIFLEPKNFILQEVVVKNRPANEIVLEVLQNSKKQLEKSILLSTYYREFVKINDTYTNFSDGMLDYNIKRKSGASDLYVRQSRAYKLKDSLSSERQKTIEGIYFYDVHNAVSDAYNFKSLKNILESKNYEYIIETKTDDYGKTVEEVKISPKEGVQLGLYYGTVIYDVETKLILNIDLKKSPDYKKYIPEVNAVFFKFKVNEEARKSSFKIDGEKYILVYNQNKINIYIKMKDKIDATYEFLSDLITTEYKEGLFDFDRSKRHKERSLFAAGNNFNEEYWKTNNIILLSDDEEKILSALK